MASAVVHAAARGVVGRVTAAFTRGAAPRSRLPSVAAAADSVILVSSSANNCFVTVSDLDGRVVSRASGGMVPGMKHRARASPQASSAAAVIAINKALAKGYRVAHLELKGPSRGRGQVLRGITNVGMKLVDIRDVTPVPMPGTRPPAARRL